MGELTWFVMISDCDKNRVCRQKNRNGKQKGVENPDSLWFFAFADGG